MDHLRAFKDATFVPSALGRHMLGGGRRRRDNRLLSAGLVGPDERDREVLAQPSSRSAADRKSVGNAPPFCFRRPVCGRRPGQQPGGAVPGQPAEEAREQPGSHPESPGQRRQGPGSGHVTGTGTSVPPRLEQDELSSPPPGVTDSGSAENRAPPGRPRKLPSGPAWFLRQPGRGPEGVKG